MTKSDPAQSIQMFIKNICKLSSKRIETTNLSKKQNVKKASYILSKLLKAQAILLISQYPVNEALD